MAFVQASTVAISAVGGNCSPSRTGTTAGNLLVLKVGFTQQTNGNPPTSSGWTAVENPGGISFLGGAAWVGSAQFWKVAGGGTETATVVPGSGSTSNLISALIEEHDGFPGVAVGVHTNGQAASGTSGNTGTSGATTELSALVSVALAMYDAAGTTRANNGITTPATAAYLSSGVLQDNLTASAVPVEFSRKYVTAKSTQIGNWLWTNSSAHQATVVTFYPVLPLQQKAFRFGLDDGNESGHTWAEAQDTNVIHQSSTNLLLRLLLQSATDLAAFSPALWARKNGAGEYAPVLVGSSTQYTTATQPTGSSNTTVTTAGSPWNIARPEARVGDLVVFIIAWDDSTDVTSVTAGTAPDSGTVTSIVGPVASASSEMRMQAWYYIATADWGAGNVVFTPSASETCRSVAFAIPAGQFNPADPIGWANTSASAGTAETTLNSPTGTAESNDTNGRLFIAYGSDTDAITAPASGTTTVNNSTGGGVGLCVVSRNSVVSSSESVSAISATIAGDSWAALTFVVKPLAITPEVWVAASSNITAGGEATTQRLTSGTGSFLAGRRWDDENGTDSLNPASAENTEVEWCLQSNAADGTFFDFRAYAGGPMPLETYTSTPRWTIGTPVVAQYEPRRLSLSKEPRPGHGPYSLGRFFKPQRGTTKVEAVQALANVKVWNGSAFQVKPLKVWTGSAWVVPTPKVWNGSSWVEV